MQQVYDKLILGLKDFAKKTGLRKGVIGLSGGIDSTLTFKISVDALGRNNIIGLIMPELGLTSQDNIDHAKKLASYFEIKYYYRPINTFVTDFRNLPWRPNKLAEMNMKARVRMILLYSLANTENAFVIGTSNKTELLLGYTAKYGDAACDVEVIGDLLKTEVYEMAKFLELPEAIIKKEPTAELAKGQTDEQELGATYKDLDLVLKQYELGANELIKKGIPAQLVNKVFRMIEKSKHKRAIPPIIKAA